MDHITRIIESGKFDRLIDMPEGPVLEVKGTPYDLDKAADRYELAKDVSSLANSQGGYLLLGLRTRRAPDAAIDVIEALAPIPEAAFPVGQYEGVIRSHVYPEIQGLGAGWRKLANSNDGIGIVHVPAQHPDLGPFLIVKVVADEEYLKQVVVGYAERTGSSNEPLPTRKLHAALKKGRDTHSQRLTRLETKVDLLIEHIVPAVQAEAQDFQVLTSRIDSILREAE